VVCGVCVVCRAQYNIPPNTLVTTNVTQCVVEFEQQYYSPSDLTLFLEQTGLPTDTPVTVIGTVPTPLTAHTAHDTTRHATRHADLSLIRSLLRTQLPEPARR
jgi:hypothetical protein